MMMRSSAAAAARVCRVAAGARAAFAAAAPIVSAAPVVAVAPRRAASTSAVFRARPAAFASMAMPARVAAPLRFAAVSAPAVSFSSAALPPAPAGVELLCLPALSPTMTDGALAQWTVAVGSVVNAGDAIAVVGTDKASVPFEAQERCVLVATLVAEGASGLPVGTPVAVTAEDEDAVPAAKAYAELVKAAVGAGAGAGAAAPAAAAAAAPAAAAKPAAAASTGSAGPPYTHTLPLSPAVAHLVHTLALDTAMIKATGPKGRILKGDVLAALESGAVAKGTAKKTAAAPAAKAAAAAPAPAAGKAAAVPGMSARRLARRTFVDVPVAGAGAGAGAGGKAPVPHFYLQTEVVAYDAGAGAGAGAEGFYTRVAAQALASVLTPAVARVGVTAGVATGNGPAVVARANTTTATAIQAAVDATATGKAAAAGAGAPVDLHVSLLPVTFANTPIPQGALAAVTVSAPSAKVTDAAAGTVVSVARVGVSVDVSVLGEDDAARVAEKIQQYCAQPAMMLL